MLLNGSAVKICGGKTAKLGCVSPKHNRRGSDMHSTGHSRRVSAKMTECGQNVGGRGRLLDPWCVRIGRMRFLGALVAGIDHERDAPSPEFKRNRVARPVSQFGVQNGHVR